MVDAGFNDLVRPALYGAYHGMELIHSDGTAVNGLQFDTVVAGPLCESGDVFTQGDGGVVLHRSLPQAQVGDLLVLHDTGAYGASMSSNYNARPLIAEVLMENGSPGLFDEGRRWLSCSRWRRCKVTRQNHQLIQLDQQLH
jgi:diaminopimelate decarboxylase